MSHHHGNQPGGQHDGAVQFTQEFWDDRYRSAGQLWSGQPNPQLVAHAAGLDPGDALDAGCGEGADAIWLAGRGWQVTAVDVSAVALQRSAAHAAQRGPQTTARIRWQREDLRGWAPPAGRFDLVSAQFMYLPGAVLGAMQRRLAAAVRPGGTLLIVGHHRDDLALNLGRTGSPEMFWQAGDLAAALDPGEWQIVVAGPARRPATDRDGQPVTVTDTVLRAARR
jgi:SAM-dependent methyltransferase